MNVGFLALRSFGVNQSVVGPHRLAWSRTLGSHPRNPGSNPGGATRITTLNQSKIE